METRNYRSLFNQCISEAENQARMGELGPANISCTQALDYLTKMQEIGATDCRRAAEACHEIANKYFNNEKHQRAADYYHHGIQCLIHIEKLEGEELKDKDYRNLAGLFIDLSDAYMHLCNADASNNAFSHAIKAFNLIKTKTPDEAKVANANDDYASFRKLYEIKLSMPSYFESSACENHGKILFQHQAEKKVEAMLSDMIVSSEMKDEYKLDDMMEGLTFTTQSPFSQPTNQREPNDDDYRTLGNQYKIFAESQCAQQKIYDAIETLKQARSAFEKIRNKSTSDDESLLIIEKYITQLEQHNSSQPWQQSSTRPLGMGIFTNPTRTSSPSSSSSSPNYSQGNNSYRW